MPREIEFSVEDLFILTEERSLSLGVDCSVIDYRVT